MDDQDQKFQQLKTYFQNRDDVVMAFVFGSQAKGYARKTSDWDIGAYIREENREREHDIWGEVEKIVGTEVDFVVLNRAPASIAWTILRTGIPLCLKDRRLFLRFLLRVSHEANAWFVTARNYHRIFERSASLSEEDRERLQRTIQFFRGEISDFERFKKLTWQEYRVERSKQREVERWAEQLMNAVINVAEIVLASERRVIPETYRFMVLNLGTVSPFDRGKLCESLAQWTDLRNMLAHEYLDYRWKDLEPFIKGAENSLQTFTECIVEFLKIDQE